MRQLLCARTMQSHVLLHQAFKVSWFQSKMFGVHSFSCSVPMFHTFGSGAFCRQSTGTESLALQIQIMFAPSQFPRSLIHPIGDFLLRDVKPGSFPPKKNGGLRLLNCLQLDCRLPKMLIRKPNPLHLQRLFRDLADLTGGIQVCTQYLDPKVCEIMTFMAIVLGVGLFFYILLGFRYIL